eukprot:1194941-Pleurochrysis_carterae.AAC.1
MCSWSCTPLCPAGARRAVERPRWPPCAACRLCLRLLGRRLRRRACGARRRPSCRPPLRRLGP